mmetsp:Transcript_22456/g.37661  ORF Transcript_22456/g.37661 Transcript_22456/m.37661 type:complete len:152 (+) Transcript_22456:100-555(+)
MEFIGRPFAFGVLRASVVVCLYFKTGVQLEGVLLDGTKYVTSISDPRLEKHEMKWNEKLARGEITNSTHNLALKHWIANDSSVLLQFQQGDYVQHRSLSSFYHEMSDEEKERVLNLSKMRHYITAQGEVQAFVSCDPRFSTSFGVNLSGIP